MLVFCMIVTLAIYLMTIGAFLRVRGLRGAYGKGIWCNSSPILWEALDDRNASTFLSFIITVSWLLYLW